MQFPEARVSKRKHQQVGTPANQKLGHIAQRKALARRTTAVEALYIDQARIGDIGINPKYRNAIDPFHCEVAVAKWENYAAQWDVAHDVVRKPKPTNKKSRTRSSTARAADTYRSARRNALRTGVNGGMKRSSLGLLAA